MYTNYFSLTQAPFSIAPDPRYLFMSERHREALAHLLYGINSGGGFVLLTGEIGAGKTTVCRCFIEQIPDNCRLAYIFNPKMTVGELLQSVCEEFRIAAPSGQGVQGGVKAYIDAINAYLLESHARGCNNVLVIDEAQNLSADVLEQLRLLTNLETSERKLLQIILIGQPELRTMLARPELEQLAQRVIARYHLGPLSEPETGAYIAHRMAVAGSQGAPVFPDAIVPLVHRISGGVPRRINLLCDRVLLGAYVENSREATPIIVRTAAAEVFAGEGGAAAGTRAGTAAGAHAAHWQLAGGVLAGAILSAAVWQVLPDAAEPARQVAASGTVTVPTAAKTEAAPARAALVAARPAPLAGQGVLALGRPDETSAVRALATRWGRALPEGEPCQVAYRIDLRCHQGRGGIYELRQLDRPAVITLRDGAATRYAVLVGMDAQGVTLDTGRRRERVALADLAPRFTGEYTTFWKMPKSFRDQLVPGDQGPDVDWIATRLSALGRAPTPPQQQQKQQPFDARTKEALRAFQQQQGLTPDGVAGPRTYIRLNQLTGVEEPRLLAAARTGP